MRVIRADVLGMCFGVRDALAAIQRIGRPERVTIHGELVHNEQVLDRLRERGFAMVDESHRYNLPLTDTILITAHGVSEKERRRLTDAGKTLVDTTCPLVTRAHDAAQKLAKEGRHVLVIGQPGHIEVQGIVEDLPSCDVVARVEDVRTYAHAKLGVLCQTTTPVAHAERTLAAIRAANSHADVRFIDTICHPTKDHQAALEALLAKVDAVVVVGGKNSNNTKQLVRRCQERDLPAYHVQDADDLHPGWFDGIERVGLTAGTSTLAETIERVYERLLTMDETVPASLRR